MDDSSERTRTVTRVVIGVIIGILIACFVVQVLLGRKVVIEDNFVINSGLSMVMLPH